MEIGIYSVIGFIVFCFGASYLHDRERDKLLLQLRKELERGATPEGVLVMMDIHLKQTLNWVNTVTFLGLLFFLCVVGWPLVLVVWFVGSRMKERKPRTINLDKIPEIARRAAEKSRRQ
jgi:hypothetical protein